MTGQVKDCGWFVWYSYPARRIANIENASIANSKDDMLLRRPSGTINQRHSFKDQSRCHRMFLPRVRRVLAQRRRIGCARRVLFDNRSPMSWIELLQKQDERETRRTATHATDVHAVAPTHLLKLSCNLVHLFVSILPCRHGKC